MTKANSGERNSPIPSDLQIERILCERIDLHKQAMGIVVGIVEPQGRRLIAHGHFTKDDPRPVDADTVFEIGSITKVFTTLLLADMAEKGEVGLNDPVAKYLPEGVSVPERDGQVITLAALATHMSALPTVPDNMISKDDADPYADYSVEQLYQFLSTYQLTYDIGTRYEYSNVGFGLLGHALARHSGMDFETLVRQRITKPLGMDSTAIGLSAELQTRLAPGHEQSLEPVSNWHLPTLAGAGALRSTAEDMLAFMELVLDGKASPLGPALALALKPRQAIGDDIQIGLGWIILKAGDEELIFHNGGTGGYCSFFGFLPKTGVGVVVLSNTVTDLVDNIGRHLLHPATALDEPPKQRFEIKVDPDLYDSYAGLYRLAPDIVMAVTRENDRLLVQLTDQPKFQAFPESERDFFFKVVNAQITFDADVGGRATGLTLHQFGKQMPAPRIQ